MPFGWERLALAPMGVGVDCLIWVARATTALPHAAFAVPPIPPWGIVVLAGGMAWAGLWRSRLRLAGLPLIALGLASPALYRSPDLLVSADARLVAARVGGALYVQRQTGASNFTLDAWRQLAATENTPPLPEGSEIGGGALTCSLHSCLLRPTPEDPAALIVRGTPKSGECARADIIVAVESAKPTCRNGPFLVGRSLAASAGAIAIWLEPKGARIVTDRELRGERPWVWPPPPQAAPAPRLPLAEPESLPPD
jgi:competence protein ComEC